LLSVLAKLLERVIANRVQSLYVDCNLGSDLQFGFKPGRGTDDALRRLTTTIRNCKYKYAVVKFFDIAGAFDNLWWPAILGRIKKTNCSFQLFNILKDYFNQRLMILTSRFDQVTKKMTKGCPQGSIIGPLAWNWCMDELLSEMETLEAKGTYATAYADDLALVVGENSRTKVEESASVAIDIFLNWCATY